jgi:hypothetical protein
VQGVRWQGFYLKGVEGEPENIGPYIWGSVWFQSHTIILHSNSILISILNSHIHGRDGLYGTMSDVINLECPKGISQSHYFLTFGCPESESKISRLQSASFVERKGNLFGAIYALRGVESKAPETKSSLLFLLLFRGKESGLNYRVYFPALISLNRIEQNEDACTPNN